MSAPGLTNLELFSRMCGRVVALMGTAMLMGWLVAPETIARDLPLHLPMSPSTALAFMFLGLHLALRFRAGSPPALQLAARACGFVVMGISLLNVLRETGWLRHDIDAWISGDPALAPVTRMTRISMGVLLVQPVALLLLQRSDDRRMRALASFLGGVTALIGTIFSIAYFYGHPMRPVIGLVPVQLTSALAITFAGLGIVTAAGRDVQPLRTLLADTVEALLLRTFLPLILGIVFLQGVIRSVILLRMESALVVVAGLTLFWLVVIGLALVEVARIIGQRIEKMEHERTHAAMQSRLKSELLASLSHKIRTPMNAVLGMAALLQRTQLDPAQREYVEVVRSGAENLIDLLNDILDLSRIEAGRLQIERESFDLAATIRSTSEMFAHLAHQKGLTYVIEFTGQSPARVIGDQKRLRQVLTNLIGNAVKFTTSGRIAVRGEITATAPEQVDLRVVVEDTGIGLTPEQLARVFSRFEPDDSSEHRLLGGAGLGLSISHELVKLMKGTLTLESKVGEGAVFELRLPFPLDPSSSRAGPTVSGEMRAATARRERLLVVDDNSMNLMVAVRMLAAMGLDADQAQSGREAVEATRRARYPLILMDCEMPDVDGYEATRMIRSAPPEAPTPPDVPIVALTAHALHGHIQRCLEVGMNDILTKPVNLETLTRAVTRWLPGAVPPEARSAAAPGPSTAAGTASLEDGPASDLPETVRQLEERRRILEETLGADSTRSIVRLYLETLERGCRALVEAWKDADPEEVGREAHRLKGASLNVGAQALANLCAGLEEMARREPIQGPPTRIAELLEEAEQVRRTLDPWA